MNFIVLIFLFTTSLFASSNFMLNEVNVTCPASLLCTQRTTRLKNLVGEYRSLLHLKDTLKVMASDGGYQSFDYSLLKNKETYSLDIKFKMKPTIKEIDIGFIESNLDHDPNQLISLKEGDFFETQKLKANLLSMKKRLDGYGFPNNTHTLRVLENNDQVNIYIGINLGKPLVFKGIKTNSKSLYIQNYLENKFRTMYNRPFDQNQFKVYLDSSQKELFSYGYYLINLEVEPIVKGKNRVFLDIKVTNEQLYAFDFKNLIEEDRKTVHDLVVDLFRKFKRPLSDASLRNALRDHYQKKALLSADFKIEVSEYVNMYKEVVQLYRIIFNENGKTRFSDVSFFGHSFFSKNKLKRMFEKEAFELASLNFYDKEYFSYFQDYLKTEYVAEGFVQAKISDPIIVLSSDKKTATLEYSIVEGVRAFIKKVTFEGLDREMEEKVLDVMANQVGKPFNPISMMEDIRKVTSTLQENGYYYAEVLNANDNELVQYSRSGSEVFINFRIDTGPIVRLNRVLYLGNDKTKRKVIRKKINIERGELITPNRTREIEAALSATGLFNSVSVSPLKHNSQNTSTDLVVKVVEREYGLIELAPGYRTDLGLKLTATWTYQNIGGYNRALTLKSTLNQRIDDLTLDPERRGETKKLLEHNTSLSFSQGDIFDTEIDASASMAYQTKRFYAFDANIYRINGTLTRDLTRHISSSVRYQYEDIKQYNATEEIDNGSFVIGAIIPSLTFDFRNNQVNPTKGTYFNLSTEFANPYFLSQKEPDLTINYYKLISRNRFYIPFKNGTVAISLVGGVQENLAKDLIDNNGTEQTEGYIPNIKVFRLTGMDIIRGFTDEEMNKLPDGTDISKARIDNRAYMLNFKLEPRYYINDNFIAGVFYDAGRVFVDRVNLGELRDSVGVTFKILTPVGTLDFDYGIKLLRKTNANGSLEDPGRFHVSIGFF